MVSTLSEIEERVGALNRVAEDMDDSLLVVVAEKELYREVLEAIASGSAYSAREFAKAALKVMT